MRRYQRLFCVAILVGSLSPVPAFSQTPMQLPPEATGQRNEENPEQAKWKRDMLKKANKDRQAQIQRDTEKLLKLATELKEYVEKSNENMLSLDVLKKAEEIEKLAHSVKEKMKTSY